MKKIILFVFLVLAINCISRGQNLVPNYSFENIIDCPNTISKFNLVEDWFSTFSSTVSVTPDLHSRCSDYGKVSIPSGNFGFQETASGDNYAGVIIGSLSQMGDPEAVYTEYITVKLVKKLEAGKCYYGQMKVNRIDSSHTYVKNFGMYFSAEIPKNNNPYNVDYSSSITDVEPQILDDGFLEDKENWISVDGCFIADGTEEYLTIGNFDDYEDLEIIPSGYPWTLIALLDYRLIDDVELYELDDQQTLNFQTCNGECLTIDGIEYCDEGNYQIDIGDASGCANSSILNLNIDTSEIEVVLNDSGILHCNDEPFLIDGGNSIGHGLEFKWYDLLGQVLSTNETLEVSEKGKYYLYLKDTFGCMTNDFIVIDNPISPTSQIENDSLLSCKTPSLILDGFNSIGTDLVYNWFNEAGDIISFSKTVEVSDMGLYSLVVMDTLTNCQDSTSVEILGDFEMPIVTAEVLQHIDCVTGIAILERSQLGTGSEYTYEWYGPSDIDDPSNNIIEVTESGMYSLVVTNLVNGCQSDSIKLNVLEQIPPTSQIENDSLLSCKTPSLILDGSNSIGTDLVYSWVNDSGEIISSSKTVEVSDMGLYSLVVIDTSTNCQDSNSVEILGDFEMPIVTAEVLQHIDCETGIAILERSQLGTGSEYTYEWYGPSDIDDPSKNIIEITESGMYSLVVTNLVNGCQSDSLKINVLEQTFTGEPIIKDLPSCESHLGAITITGLNLVDEPPYIFSIEGVGANNNGVFKDIPEGNYMVVIEDGYGCVYLENIDVSPEQYFVDFSEIGIDVDYNEEVVLEIQTNIPNESIDSIIWSPTTGLSCTDCLNPSALIQETTIYQVSVTDSMGCAYNASIAIRVDDNLGVYFPNTFTPNADGINDQFGLFAKAGIIKSVKYLKVYDRWGELIFNMSDFQLNDPLSYWDGFFKGQQASQGTYYYRCEIEFIDSSIEFFTGSIQLTR